VKNTNINISIPSEILLTLRKSDAELALDMKRWTALKLFEEKRLSIGQSAELAEMYEDDFVKFMGANKVSIFSYLSYKELGEDLNNA